MRGPYAPAKLMSSMLLAAGSSRGSLPKTLLSKWENLNWDLQNDLKQNLGNRMIGISGH